MKKRWWFLAVNGASCAACSFPVSEGVKVSPRPEILIGFTTQEQQLSRQKELLECPADDLGVVFGNITIDRMQGLAIVKTFDDAEPPTSGPTVWVD